LFAVIVAGLATMIARKIPRFARDDNERVRAYITAFELIWWRWTVLRRRVVTQGDAA